MSYPWYSEPMWTGVVTVSLLTHCETKAKKVQIKAPRTHYKKFVMGTSNNTRHAIEEARKNLDRVHPDYRDAVVQAFEKILEDLN